MRVPSTPIAAPLEMTQRHSPAMETSEGVDKILDTIEVSSFEEVMKERNRVRPV
jgi:hypothetical protein